jgi:hypothetical protein
LFELEHVKKKITDRNATTAIYTWNIFIHANLYRESKTEWKYQDPYVRRHEIRLRRVAQETLVPELECFVRKKKKNKISN